MFKRLFDVFTSFMGLILLIPIMVIIAIIIKIRMPGRIFFIQERVGQNGIIFSMVKFRTMVEVHDGLTITLKGDKRVTPFGAWLRRYKLDELPELWNVLKGDMSFVGPRPDVPGYADTLTGEASEILKLRPGITGPATLKYSSEEELLASAPDPVKYNKEVIFPDKVRINLEYLRTRSFMGDIGIIFRTIFRKY